MGCKFLHWFVFLIPFVASCSSMTGVAKKDSLSCDPRQVAQAAKPRMAASCEVSRPTLSAELCSVTTEGHPESCMREEKVLAPASRVCVQEESARSRALFSGCRRLSVFRVRIPTRVLPQRSRHLKCKRRSDLRVCGRHGRFHRQSKRVSQLRADRADRSRP